MSVAVETNGKQVERFYGELWNRWVFRIVGEILTEESVSGARSP